VLAWLFAFAKILANHSSSHRQRVVCLLRGATTCLCFLQASMGTAGTTATVPRDTEITTQIFQGARTLMCGFLNLTVSDGLANTDVHGDSSSLSERMQMRTILILFK
jgi:hypothetical protein